jgi:hypothetical protein
MVPVFGSYPASVAVAGHVLSEGKEEGIEETQKQKKRQP